ncbi:30S ribosomal protein S16 [Staphylococcus aureus]
MILTRLGSKRNPFYRIVVADARSPRDGRIIEQIGISADPTTYNAPEIKVDEALALKWLNDGAKPTDTVHNILSKEGIMKKFDEQKKAK